MGRDVTGLPIDKKPNNVPKSDGINHVTVHVAPRVAAERVQRNDANEQYHNSKSVEDENGLEKKDVLGLKSTNYNPGLSDSKAPKSESIRLGEKKQIPAVKPALGSAAVGVFQSTSPAPVSPFLTSGKEHSSVTGAVNLQTSINGGEKIPGHFPVNAKVSQPISPSMSVKAERPDDYRYHHEEDNLSLASSAATSVRTTKSRITVPVGPKFVSSDRLSRRREFYQKLEEKHKALEAEKLEVAARTKEEEAAAIKQLRKTMTYKANPVPSFYREGPPPKTELKKLPVTRAKSPNLSRRKSCSDATKSSPDVKVNCGRIKRHSIGVHKEGSGTTTTTTTHRKKDTLGSWNSGIRSSKGSSTPTSMKSENSLGKANVIPVNRSKDLQAQVKETSKSRMTVPEMRDADISIVQEEINTSSMGEYVADVSVVEETVTSPAMEVREEEETSYPKMAEKRSADIGVEA